MAKLLVSGGAGFLGSHLCRALLDRGDEVACVDNLSSGRLSNIRSLREDDAFSFLHHDVTDPLPIPDDGFDAVLHFASPASPADYLRNPIETLRVGSLGTLNLLELARRVSARFFLASTSEVYGDPKVHPQAEAYWGNVNPVGLRSVYDESKRFVESAAMAYHRKLGLDVRIARIFNTYGPGMSPTDGRVITHFIVSALRDQALRIYGTGSQTRSFCYIDDEIQGLLALLDSDYVGPVNIGGTTEVTIRDLAEMVLEITGSSSPLVYEPLPTDDPLQRKPEVDLAAALFGWKPSVDLRTGLVCTTEWFRGELST